MSEPTTLGTWLRRERERRGVTLAKISEETKVGVPLLEGLEADDLSRWPGGIFRRAFTRSYAAAIGLDPELVVRRVEEEHPSEPVVNPQVPNPTSQGTSGVDPRGKAPAATSGETTDPWRSADDRTPAAARAAATGPRMTVADGVPRIQAVALDLLVAGAIGLGFAAAGSRLLWPVIAIAAYHAVGVFLSGTTPMMALLSQPRTPIEPVQPIALSQPAETARRAETEPRPEPRQVRRARARRTARSEQAAGGRR